MTGIEKLYKRRFEMALKPLAAAIEDQLHDYLRTEIAMSGAAGRAVLEAAMDKSAERLSVHDRVIGTALIDVFAGSGASIEDEDAMTGLARHSSSSQPRPRHASALLI